MLISAINGRHLHFTDRDYDSESLLLANEGNKKKLLSMNMVILRM